MPKVQRPPTNVPPVVEPQNDLVNMSTNSSENDNLPKIIQEINCVDDTKTQIDSLFHHLYNQRVGDTTFYLAENAKLDQKVREVQRHFKIMESKFLTDHTAMRKQNNDIRLKLNGLTTQVDLITQIVSSDTNNEIQKKFEMYERIITEQNRTFSEQLQILFHSQQESTKKMQESAKKIEYLENQLKQTAC